MSRFTVSRVSTADVDASMDDVFTILEQPQKVAELTPYLDSIVDRGDGTWVWRMGHIRAPMGLFQPEFTERMTIERPTLLEFRHEPPAGRSEMAGADGIYRLMPRADGRPGCTLHIDLTVTTYLPLPALAKPVVRSTMNMVIDQMGKGFSRNIIAELERA